MRDKQRKKAQSKINHMIKDLNENIRHDSLWRGRFYLHQTDATWWRFEDGSGGILKTWIEIRDKKTGIYYGFSIDNYDRGWHLWSAANDFICEKSGVWDNIDEVRNDKTNWNKVKWFPVKEVY